MSNIRSIKRKIARHPVNVWRAKQKTKEMAEAAEMEKAAKLAKEKEVGDAVQSLVTKWEKTGLLDGVKTDANINQAILIESQERQPISDITK